MLVTVKWGNLIITVDDESTNVAQASTRQVDCISPTATGEFKLPEGDDDEVDNYLGFRAHITPPG